MTELTPLQHRIYDAIVKYAGRYDANYIMIETSPEALRTAIQQAVPHLTDEEILNKSRTYATDKIETSASLQQGILIGGTFARKFYEDEAP